jgi:hypothetical protein
MENPDDFYVLFLVNNDDLGLNSNPGKNSIYFYNEICHGSKGKK